MEKTHAQSPVGGGEYSICGIACDAYESGDVETEIRFAAEGEPVTCKECRRAVIQIRKIKLGRLTHPTTR